MPVTREVSVAFLQRAIVGAAQRQGLPNPLPRSCKGNPLTCDGLWGLETKTVLLQVLRQAAVPITPSSARDGDRRITLTFPSEAAMTAAMNTLESFAAAVPAPAAPPPPAATTTPDASIVPASGGLRMPDWGWGLIGVAIVGGTFVAWRLVSRGR